MAKPNGKQEAGTTGAAATAAGAGVGGNGGSGRKMLPPRSPARRVDPSTLNLRRSRPDREDEIPPPEIPSVSAGPIDKVIELAFNPSREKIREVTIIDRMQGRLFPIMDTMNTLYRDCIKVASYRQSRREYAAHYHEERPGQIDIMDELMFRTAQWQKSVAGRNLDKATDIALAETETRSEEPDDTSGAGRGYEE